MEVATAERSELRKQLAENFALIKVAAGERAELNAQLTTLTEEMRWLTRKLQDENTGLRARVQRPGATHLGGQARVANRPSVKYASKQPTHVSELGHDTLAELAMNHNHSATRERLLREIMCVEDVSWEEAHKTLDRLDEFNEKFYWYESLPFRIGITGAFVIAIGGTMMVFHRPVAVWYAVNVAGEAQPEDISNFTVNQVGTWTWSWMEPMIGTASLVLLCCQFARGQARSMCMKTYGEYILQWRANRLARHIDESHVAGHRKFPQYDRSMVRAWSKHMPRVGYDFFPIYERNEGLKGPTSGL